MFGTNCHFALKCETTCHLALKCETNCHLALKYETNCHIALKCETNNTRGFDPPSSGLKAANLFTTVSFEPLPTPMVAVSTGYNLHPRHCEDCEKNTPTLCEKDS